MEENLLPEGLSTKAQMIWSMLDDMAENDPSAYTKFIEQQIKEGKAQFALPEPHLCIEVLLHKKPRRPLFVNFCSWSKVPEPKSDLHPVPVSGTEIMDVDKDERGFYSVTSVAFNQKVLDELDQAGQAERCTLFNLALDYIEHEHKVKVTRKYKILPPEVTHKGDFKLIQQSFAKNLKNRQKGEEKKKDEPDSTLDDSLLCQLSNIVTGDSGKSSGSDASPSIHLPGLTPNTSSSSSKKGSGLIEEIKEDGPSTRLTTPRHSLTQNELDTGHVLVLTVDLPGVHSVADCQLDISEDDVKLVVPSQYDLRVKLPSCIDQDEARARFSKKTSVLSLTMPVKS